MPGRLATNKSPRNPAQMSADIASRRRYDMLGRDRDVGDL